MGVKMSRYDVHQSNSQFLRDLLALDEWQGAAWGEEELRAVWQQQRLLPIRSYAADQPSPAAQSNEPAESNLIDVLHGISAPLAELQAMKDAAKDAMAQQTQAVPPQIAGVLYHIAIAVALRDHAKWISTIDREKLSEGLAWAYKQTWIDADTREAIQKLDNIAAP